MPLPNLPGETNNYFVAAPFEFNRWTLDTKVNWNATSKLNIFGRYSHLDFWTFNEDGLRRHAAGRRRSPAAIPGTGQGYTANFSAGGTYTFSPTLVADAHFGYVRMYTDVAHSDIGQNKGMELLGIPGLNGPRAVRGRHAGLRLQYVPGYRDHRALHAVHRNDDQYQTVVNVNWMKGKHNVRFGTDIYFQALNHIQPELTRRQLRRARRLPVRRRPDAAQRWADGQHVQRVGRVPARAARPARPPEPRRCAPYTTRMRSYSFYVRDQWQVDQSPDAVLRHALRVLPDADARRSRARTLQPRHQHDGDRRRRLGADGSRRQDRERACSRRESA